MTSPRPSTPSSTLPDALRTRILAQAAATPAPTRTQTQLRLLALAGTAAVWLVFLSLAHGRRPDWSAEPAWMVWTPLLDASLAAVVITSLAVSRGRTLLGAPVSWLLGAMILVPAVTGAVVVASVLGALGDAAWLPRAMELRTSLGCDVFSLAIALPLLGLFLLSLRGRTLPAPAWIGATGGVCAGTWSHAALSWVCPWNDPVHLVVGHLLPSLPLALLGAWAAVVLTRRASRPRSSSRTANAA